MKIPNKEEELLVITCLKILMELKSLLRQNKTRAVKKAKLTRDAWAIHKQFRRQKPAHTNNYYIYNHNNTYITHLPTPPSFTHISLSLSLLIVYEDCLKNKMKY